MSPTKPFDTYKWRWLSVAPTESLLDPPVFLGVLRVLANHETEAPSQAQVLADLARVQQDTGSPVNLARTGDRNLIRNSGQYWKGTGLLTPVSGQIHLTPLGRRVANGAITQGEFAALMVQQTTLPNPWTYSTVEIARWQAAGLEIRPLKLILSVIEDLGRNGIDSAYLTNNELVKIVIPMAGDQSTSLEIAHNLVLYRQGTLDISDWPDCAPMANDKRLAREFLLFLSNFGLLRLNATGIRDEQRFSLEELFDVDAATAPLGDSIFGDVESAARAVEDMRHSSLPSIVERQRTLTTVLARTGQSGFRSRVLNAFQTRCLITGEEIREVLEAAHIVPVNHGGSDQENNGLCLRVDVHRLFDSGNLRIRPSGELMLSDATGASPNYGALPKQIAIPAFINPANIVWRESYL